MTINLVIIEPRKLIAESLQAAFISANAFSRVGMAEDFPAKIEGPTLFLIVVRSYWRTCQTLQQLQIARPDATIVILDEQFRYGGGLLVRDTVVHGYWTFHDSVQEIIQGMIRANRRSSSISPSLNDYFRHSRQKGVQMTSRLLEHPFYQLSKRERQLFNLIADGKKIEACAVEMNIAPKTISNLREKLMKKFNVSSGTDLVWKVIEAGLIDSRYLSSFQISTSDDSKAE